LAVVGEAVSDDCFRFNVAFDVEGVLLEPGAVAVDVGRAADVGARF